ncbi:MAG TPA: pyridoxal-dependent decarboxylase [Methylococcus sp.]|nr:pyridoxal-dependent decarboxylase [Methylococcus sp.]
MTALRRHYSEILETLKTYFPAPVSNPILDGYFVHTVSNFLDRVDGLKSAAPILDVSVAQDYEPYRSLTIPEGMTTVEEITQMLADYCRGMVVWAHPNAQANVIPPPTVASIMAFVASAIYNPNIIWDEYSARFAEAEIEAVSMLAGLVGYDQERASGMFTFGGTGTLLYGMKLAIEKMSCGRAMREGVRKPYKILASDVSHYSRVNVAAWLGLGSENVVTIPSTLQNEMSLTHLEETFRQLLDAGEEVAAIIVTLGTTDAFGIDDLAAIRELRDRLVEEYRLPHRPHIHADAVIGWPWLVFRDYDFEANPLGFHARTLRSLQDSAERIGFLDRADSIGLDFHKTGYAPYISSVILVKDRNDLGLLSRDPAEMPYLYQFGRYHPGLFTLECSRSGGGALAALANLRLLGKEGYRVILGHSVEMSEWLRERLEGLEFVRLLNDRNFGPVSLFRLYPSGTDASVAWRRELTDPGYAMELERNNRFNRRVFDLTHERAMRGEGVLLSWTDAYRPAWNGEGRVAAIKSFIMSPWTDHQAVDKVVDQIGQAWKEADAEFRA